MAKARIPAVAIDFGLAFDPVNLVPAHLVKQPRRLIYDYNAIAELQDIAGTYHSDVNSLKSLRAVVWAGLLAETLDKHGRETERTMSIIDVGDILHDMSPEGRDALISAVLEARGIAEPPKDPPPTGETGQS